MWSGVLTFIPLYLFPLFFLPHQYILQNSPRNRAEFLMVREMRLECYEEMLNEEESW